MAQPGPANAAPLHDGYAPRAPERDPRLDHDDDDSMRPPPPQLTLATRSESKPRLSKDAQETLEAHFRQQQKPTTAQKKGFAADLNVPLEKINNWFQNRRAKVKQDIKKQQQHQEYYKALFGSHTQPPLMNGESSYVHPSFYQAVNAGPQPQANLPMHMADQFSPSRFHFPALPAGAPSQPAPPPAVSDGQAMWPGMHAGATYPQDYPTDPVFQQFFGLQDPHASDAPMIDYSNLQAYRKSFYPTQELWEQYSAPPSASLDGYATSTSASLFTASSSGDDASAHFSISDASSFHPSARHPSSSVNSVNPAGMGSSRNPSVAWPNHMRMGSQHDSHSSAPFTMGHMSTHSAAPAAPAEPAPNFDAIHPATLTVDSSALPTHLEETSTEEEMSSRSASQPALSSTMSIITTSASPENNPRRPSHAGSSSDDADISPTSTIMKAPSSTTSSLAARRQRRPAALGLNVMRSSSHSAAVPPSPGSAGLRAQSDPNLRRIKSSTGVLTGRVQKSAFSSAQRSPMHFSEATQSPNYLQRHFSASSAPSGAPDAAEDRANPTPLTPMSPPLMSSAPQSSLPSATLPVTDGGNEMLENIWNFMPNTATSTVFSWPPGYSESGVNYSSPPAPPMDAQHLAEMRLRNPSMPPLLMMPGSAPPWQTSFAPADHMPTDMATTSQAGPVTFGVPVLHAPPDAPGGPLQQPPIQMQRRAPAGGVAQLGQYPQGMPTSMGPPSHGMHPMSSGEAQFQTGMRAPDHCDSATTPTQPAIHPNPGNHPHSGNHPNPGHLHPSNHPHPEAPANAEAKQYGFDHPFAGNFGHAPS